MITEIPTSKIVEGANHRDHHIALDDLASSIREIGLLQPLLVRPLGDGTYRVVCGYRRLAACRINRLKKIQCHVKEMTDAQEAAHNLAENVSRRRPNPIDVATRLKALVDEHGYTQQKVADMMGKDQTWVSNHLRALTLPKTLQDRIARFEIGLQTALKPYRQKRQVAIDRLAEDNDSELQTVRITLARATVSAARQQARKNRQTFEAFVEENLILAIDWRGLGLPNPFEGAA